MDGSDQPWRRVADQRALAVLLVRHGRTSFNAEHRFCGGRSDPPLDERGREQAAALGQRFAGEVDKVWCSPQQRAQQTAAGLAAAGLAGAAGAPVVIEGLRELDQGAFEGLDFQPILTEHAAFFRAWKRDPTHVQIPGGGESMGELAQRVDGGVQQILAQLGGSWRGRVIAVVCHQMAQAAFVCHALNQPLRDWPQFQLRNATANLLSWDRKRWSLVARNL
ncbi:histidine phosphatase family protein [Enhygromyxa salina]|uniref:histidine phosphatase family protein n=1 Tax=Enhygromyxa salina TaxID=215803 RepID=UPI000696562A|nr:histidine phosphatase family protein [Enhygromyxa salina]